VENLRVSIQAFPLHLRDVTKLLDMVRAIVSDGITIGRPCCGVAHCTENLKNKRDRYCPGHQYQEKVCSVDGCKAVVSFNSLACANPEHAKMFEAYKLQGTANFQRKDHSLSASERSGSSDQEDSTCTQKPDNGIRNLRSHFGRRQTHNEQLMVRPCGIIVARATFYGSETVPQTVVCSLV